jgi:hypothetical protein
MTATDATWFPCGLSNASKPDTPYQKPKCHPEELRCRGRYKFWDPMTPPGLRLANDDEIPQLGRSQFNLAVIGPNAIPAQCPLARA